MKKLIILFALAACPAHAAIYYFSDCQAGAVKGCKPGNDASATPTNPNTPLRTAAEAFRRFRNAAGGDKILFAKGGSFNVIGENPIQNFNSSAANPITLGAYQPKWYTGSAKPLLSLADNTILLAFTDGGAPEADGGYVVRDLYLRGNVKSVGGSWGIFINQLTSDIKLINLTINNFEIGVHCGNDGQRITLKNSQIVNNRGQGILWSCSNSVIENNTFDNNGYGHQFLDHQMYFSSGPTAHTGTIVRGNKLTNSVHFNGNRCTGAPIVGHGKLSDMLIENNKIIETRQAGGGCWGIALDGGYNIAEGSEYFSNITIRGNVLVNVGNTGIGCSSCVDWTIENNVLLWEFPEDITAIAVPDNDLSASTKQGDPPTTNVIIRNNSIYFKQASRYAVAIRTAEEGQFNVNSNLIVFSPGTHASAQCFNTTNRGIANFDAISNNLCYHKAGARFSQDYASLLDAQTANPDWNADGQTAAPVLLENPSAANGYAIKLKPASPAVNAGDRNNCSPLAFGGKTRGSRCDIGAYEYGVP